MDKPSSSLYAQVVIDSPLPQLDRPFEYVVPSELGPIEPGVRVRVPFGRSTSLVDGFVISVSNEPTFDGSLASVDTVVSLAPVLTANVYQLARKVADRQVASVHDVLKLAIPSRSVAVEKKWLAQRQVSSTGSASKKTANLETQVVAPSTIDNLPSWCIEFVARAKAQIAAGFDTIVVSPDYRDQSVLLRAFADSEVAGTVIDYSAAKTGSARYASFLSCLGETPKVIVGNRSAIYAPSANLGLIMVWDDGDSNHQEPTSPYSHTREVALMRQQEEQCGLFFAAHSRSTEVQRLVEIGHLRDVTKEFALPRVTVTQSDTRVDGSTWQIMRKALEFGSILVQVAGRGTSTATYCATCGDRAKCFQCHGPLWIDSGNQPKCRWCNAHNQNFTCDSCGAKKLKQGRPGATQTAADLGRAFPGVQVVESNGDNQLEWLDATKKIVIATPGAEPRIDGGYAAVVLLDCQTLLARDSLRATEEAVRLWANAIALMSLDGMAVAVGVSGNLGLALQNWNIVGFARHELNAQRELRFPPAVRLASLTGERDVLLKTLEAIGNSIDLEILGPMPVAMRDGSGNDWRALARFEYSAGAKVAQVLKTQIALATAGTKRLSAKTGRGMRPIKVKMDDPEVI